MGEYDSGYECAGNSGESDGYNSDAYRDRDKDEEYEGRREKNNGGYSIGYSIIGWLFGGK